MKTTFDIPVPENEALSPSYVRGLLDGSVTTHLGKLQNAALCNRIRHNGKLVCLMDGAPFEVVPSKFNAQHLALIPLRDIHGNPFPTFHPAPPLYWGYKAFQTEVLTGGIRLDGTLTPDGWRAI